MRSSTLLLLLLLASHLSPASSQNLRLSLLVNDDPTPEPTPTPACQHNLCHKCTPDKDPDSGRPISGPGSCCDSTDTCYWDRVFKEFICLPDYPWICDAPDSEGRSAGEIEFEEEMKKKEEQLIKIVEKEKEKNDKGSSCWGTYEECFEMCPPEYCNQHNELRVPLWCCDW